jgi:hypothetical protein
VRKAVITLAMLVLGFAAAASAQTTLSTTKVNVNIGDASRAIFVFGDIPGATELVVQCDIAAPFTHPGRAWVIQNFDTTEQTTTGFIPVVCTRNFRDPLYPVSVDTTVYSTNLYDSAGTVIGPVTVTIVLADWQSTRVGCGRSGTPCYKNGSGTSDIILDTTGGAQ